MEEFVASPTSSAIIVQEFKVFPTVDAAPLCCFRETVADVLVIIDSLAPLQVILQDGQTVPISVPPAEVGLQLEEGKPTSGTPLIRLSNASGSRVSIQLLNGQVLRQDFNFSIQDILVRRCLSALSHVLPEADYLIMEVMTCNHLHQLPKEGNNEVNTAFQLFSRIVYSLMGILDHRQDSFASPWEQLLQEVDAGAAPDLRALVDKDSRFSQVASNSPICVERVSPGAFPAILLALHMTAEDARLRLGGYSDVLKLAPVIAKIGLMLSLGEYVDHWVRLAPQIVEQVPEVASESVKSLKSSELKADRRYSARPSRLIVPCSTKPPPPSAQHSQPIS